MNKFIIGLCFSALIAATSYADVTGNVSPPGSSGAVSGTINPSQINSGTLPTNVTVTLPGLATQLPSTVLSNCTVGSAAPAANTALCSATTTAGGSAPVGTTDTQTLTNKTLVAADA